ncbi:protein-glutamine glutaminase family protein [Kangiella sp.]|uniref:protein-glutamine glutaminase family protein n=1 Tax=Kangiella sp. TaxID=1920245 RepID=UPI003A90F9CF
MKTKYFLALLLALPLYSNATSVIFSSELRFDNCSTPKDVPIVYCKEADDKAIIQLGESNVLMGLVLGEKEARPFSVKSVTENGATNYYNLLSDEVYEDVDVPEYETPNTIFKALTNHSNSLSSNIETAKQEQPEIVSDLTALQELIAEHTQRLKMSVPEARRFLWVYSEENGNQNCEQLNSGKCPFLSCGDNHYLLYDINRGLFLPISYTRNNKGEAKFTKNDPTALIVRGMYTTFIRYNEEFKHSRLTDARKVPENLQNNVTAYFTFQDADFSEYLKDIIPQCPSSFKDDIISLGVQTNEERSALQFVHLVEKVNGNITSQYINKAFLPAGIRRKDNTYYTHEALKDMSKFEPGSVKAISVNKAKTLFTKAKAMKNMAWSQSQDGAFARTELMVNMFEKEGVIADKAWASGFLKSKNIPYPWIYHVAPVVYVEGSSGKVDKMIIDPLIADQPVTISQWLSLMGITNPDTVYSVGFPVSLDAKDVGKISFTITNRDAFHPTVVKSFSKEERLEEARRVLANLEKG